MHSDKTDAAKPALHLTDTEWMDLIDGSEERAAQGRPTLARCCANISELRDVIIGMARNGGGDQGYTALISQRSFTQTLGWALDHEHIEDIPPLAKIIAFLGIDVEQLRADSHQARGFE